MDNAKHTETPAFFRFGTFILDVPERRLWRGDEAVQLVPKQFDLLLYFVANAGRVTKKNEILDAVWPDTYVEETTLARNVSWLRKLIEDDGGKRLIETVPKVGYRFTPDVAITDASDLLVIEEQTVQYTRSEETITISDAVGENQPVATATRFFSPPRLIIVSLLLIAFAGSGYVIYTGKFSQSTSNPAATGPSAARKNAAIPARQADSVPIQIGSVVNLQNRYPNDGSYLDAWGEVWSKPEFRQVPTETKFVSTHIEPNRDGGSGSWEIVSASAKNKGEPLVVGDRIHLKNMYPNGGYLDACGWTEHLRVFEKFLDQTGAVFTTKSANRDNGTGVWIIRSATADVGSPIFEGDNIAIESSYFINDRGENRVSGFLNVAGKITDIPAFSDYQGSKLVFTKNLSFDQPIPDIWTILVSKTNTSEK
ncbi:MAG TPA: transcriptional regulator [Pyrinomonadaceae bacterium]|nr:transcriptional regulator [Pyrinomonadaceae bacterium]